MIKKFVSGELYRTRRHMLVIPETSFEKYFQRFVQHRTCFSQIATWIKEGEIFLFVEEIEREMSTYSKILYKDKVYLTNNVYYLHEDVERIDLNERSKDHGRI